MTVPVYLAVFDCDGTLIDGQHLIVDCMQSTFRSTGAGEVDAADIRRIIGLPLLECVSRLAPGETPERHVAIAEHYRTVVQKSRSRMDHQEPLYPGAIECLEALESEQVLLAVATGKGRRGLEMILSRHNLLDKFTVLKTADDGPGKPHPAILLDAIAETGATPGTTAMIGDTVFDIEMGRRAGTAAIGVSWGYHAPNDLRQAGADTIVQQFEEVPGTLKTLWRKQV